MISLERRRNPEKQADAFSAKVTIVGVGQVGMACAYSILNQNIASEITLFHANTAKLKGEMMDLQHGLLFCKPVKISAGTDISVTADSNIIIITAGVRQQAGESRLDLVHRNTDIFKRIIPPLAENSPDAIILIVTNPVDVLAFVAWKLSGFPPNRVIGTGTTLDTSRFLFLISERLKTSPSNLEGYVIGEHGDTSVPLWSSVKISGERLLDIYPTILDEHDPKNWRNLHKEVVNSATEIIKLKGYTNLAIGMSVASISKAIVGNTGALKPVSTLAKGFYGIKDEVYLSLPCALGSEGVSKAGSVLDVILNEEETELLLKSSQTLKYVQSKLEL